MAEILRNVLIVGSGGREHAIGWKIAQDNPNTQLSFAPGNGGTEDLGKNLDIASTDIDRLVNHAVDDRVDLVIVGPEDPLSMGLINALGEASDEVSGFGPTQEAARLESDKAFAVDFMKRWGIPHPYTEVYDDPQKALKFFENHLPQDFVIKASGLAKGKGVFLPEDLTSAEKSVRDLMTEGTLGEAGKKILIQKRLSGTEVSAIALVSNEIRMLPLAKDYKRAFDGDVGSNTGGMGAYVPSEDISQNELEEIYFRILSPTVQGMRASGTPFQGVLYAGLMLTSDGPKVLEYNVRFGDPETQVQLRLIEENLLDLIYSTAKRRLYHTPLQMKVRPGFSVGVVLASDGYPESYETGKKISGLERVGDEVVVFHAGTRREDGEIMTSGGRVITVTAVGNTREEAREKTYNAAEVIYFDGKQMRNDIAA